MRDQIFMGRGVVQNLEVIGGLDVEPGGRSATEDGEENDQESRGQPRDSSWKKGAPQTFSPGLSFAVGWLEIRFQAVGRYIVLPEAIGRVQAIGRFRVRPQAIGRFIVR